MEPSRFLLEEASEEALLDDAEGDVLLDPDCVDFVAAVLDLYFPCLGKCTWAWDELVLVEFATRRAIA